MVLPVLLFLVLDLRGLAADRLQQGVGVGLGVDVVGLGLHRLRAEGVLGLGLRAEHGKS